MLRKCIHLLFLVVFVCFSRPLFADEVTIEKVAYHGWENCYKLTNGAVELIVVTDIGPRIIHFGFVGQENIFRVAKNQLGKSDEEGFRGRGGHRFWVAPEDPVTTYYPDNMPVDASIEGNTLRLVSTPELTDPALRKQYRSPRVVRDRMDDPKVRKALRLQKKMNISLARDGMVTVEHIIKNWSDRSQVVAAWGISVLNKNGFAILPRAPYVPHNRESLLPTQRLITWSYTDLTDPRLHFMEKYIVVEQDPSIKKPVKIGISNELGWAAYAWNTHLFVKYLTYNPDLDYPDMGASTEVYTGGNMLELESLGPLIGLEPNEEIRHVEEWRLFAIEPIKPKQEQIDRAVKQMLKK
ncbi:hypothetical protein GF373_15100 [bacterium]|nr:hypothetical protein [bacterium]